MISLIPPSFRAAMLLACLIATHCRANDVKVETVLSNLHAPRGVAIRPGGAPQQYEVFVADTGAGRVVRIHSSQSGDPIDVVTGFETRGADDAQVGPSGLWFLDRNRLVVACRGRPVIRLYELRDDATPQAADALKQAIDHDSVDAAWCIAQTRANDKVPDALIVTCTGSNIVSGLGKITIRAGTLDRLMPFATSPADSRPLLAVTTSEQGPLVVAGAGEPAAATLRSRLRFLNPIDGATIMSLPVALAEIRGLAYHPLSGNLYAIDFAASDPSQGGVYRIDDASTAGKPACRVVRIAAVNHPTALAIGPDGSLYVTTADEPGGIASPDGTLQRVIGEL